MADSALTDAERQFLVELEARGARLSAAAHAGRSVRGERFRCRMSSMLLARRRDARAINGLRRNQHRLDDSP